MLIELKTHRTRSEYSQHEDENLPMADTMIMLTFRTLYLQGPTQYLCMHVISNRMLGTIWFLGVSRLAA